MLNQYLIQLMLSKGIGEVALKKIINVVPEREWQTLCESPHLLGNIINCRGNTIESVLLNKDRAGQLYLKMQKNSIAMILESDKSYPPQLKDALGSKCPPVLFAKGNIELLSTIAVGFCGSRKVSEKGLSITSQCAMQLVQKNISVVSGYAAGTDTAAHVAAIENGGNTIFVLAEGILNFSYKKQVKAHLTTQNHVFISQFYPDAQWSVGNAMKRNSIIIGLSKAMILVESGKSGGTFSAGEETLKLSLPLFVIDYVKPEVSAEANPYFISRGGVPIRGKNQTPNLARVFWAVEHGSNHENSTKHSPVQLDFFNMS